MQWVCSVAGLGAVAATVASATHAFAADTTYGRIDGDVTLVAGAGAAIAPRGPRASAELRLRYIETAGLFATYEDAAPVGAPANPERVLSTGIEVRPLFLFRWLRGHELASGAGSIDTTRARFDLAIDSLGLEFGASFSQPRGASFASRPGVQAGLGIELPIMARATGPWIGIHPGVRWSDDALSSGAVTDAAHRSAFVAVTLAWHQVIATHLVDLGDEAPR